jgi:glutathione S-transferase
MSADPILYVNALSPYAQLCVITLNEKGVAFEKRVPTSFGGGDEDPELLAINPFAEVPALSHEGLSVFESGIIFDYIETRWPEPKLMPPDAAGRAKSLMLQTVVAKLYDPINWGLTEIVMLGRVPPEKGLEIRSFAQRQAAGINTWLEQQLGNALWFAGEAFGAADIFVFPLLNGATRQALVPDESPLTDWLERMRARPSVQTVLADAAAFMASQTPETIAGWRTAKRQYRDSRIEWVIRTAGIDVIAEGLAAGRIVFSRDFAGLG